MSLTAPSMAAAADFDPNLVIGDAELRDTRVPDDFAQQFLESHGSGIANTFFDDIDGSKKKPGDLITYYGKIFGVSPRYLLALIQKEQSLVTDPNPSVCQIDWAAGYGRPDGSTCNDPNWQKHRGFVSQIIGAAAFAQCFYEDVADNCGSRRSFGFFAGAPTSIDSTPVTPLNTATAMLYSYTPHLHGNQLLTSIWGDWFTTTYPDGSYLKAPDGTVYVIQAGMKRRFASKSALASRVNTSRIIATTDDALAPYQEGSPIKFADYSLVRVPTGGIYLLVGDVKRPIASMQAFRSVGFNPDEVDDVDPIDLAGYADGTPITGKAGYPTGALLQDKKSGGVFWVESGKKHPIVSVEILKTNYPGKKPSVVPTATLTSYPSDAPITFKDGELITSPGSKGAVFVISNGARRPIVSGTVFEKLGYQWARVIKTSDAAVQVHPLGATLTL